MLDLVNTTGAYSLKNYYKLNGAANGVEKILAADKVVNEIKADFACFWEFIRVVLFSVLL